MLSTQTTRQPAAPASRRQNPSLASAEAVAELDEFLAAMEEEPELRCRGEGDASERSAHVVA